MKDGKKLQKPDDVYIAEGAICLGDVQIGTGSSIWYHATVRADREQIRIRAYTNIQDNNCGTCGRRISGTDRRLCNHRSWSSDSWLYDRNNTLIGIGAIVLNGAKIGRDCIIRVRRTGDTKYHRPRSYAVGRQSCRAGTQNNRSGGRAESKNAEEYSREGRHETVKARSLFCHHAN